MAEDLNGLLFGINAFLVGLLAIALGNWLSWRRLATAAGLRTGPHVSVLVPARDEAHQVGDCLRSLLAQDYADFDIVVLDDDSTDGTGQILSGLAAADARLQLLAGRPLPPGWTGKNWACHQLAHAATGELLLFTDADTRHHPRALGEAVATLQRAEVGLLSALPRQELRSWGEQLLVPILPWSLFSCYPELLIRRLRRPALAVAVGQFMLFRRAAYQRSGGHAAVRASPTEDVALARRMVAAGERVCLADAGDRVTCRMYAGFRQAWAGFGRSLLPALGGKPWLFLPIWIWLGLVFLLPPFALLAWRLGADSAPGPAGAAIALALLSWTLVVRRFGLPRRLVLVYPAIMALAVAVATYSLVLGLTGRATWKGRPLPAAR
jgi:chlorobactene glucosyltransferase